ncbi:MAG: CPBP family intramembrane metalloprotease [Oscillospiraceae bacterium]|nr:CPBP family intramembrane metalloprotease [Oscillospiraceae bacterium]
MNEEHNQQPEAIDSPAEFQEIPTPPTEQMARSAYSHTGFTLAATESAKYLSMFVVAMIAGIVFHLLSINFDNAVSSVYFSLALTFIVIYLVGFPLMYLMMKNRPSCPPEKRKMPRGKIILYYFMCLPLAMAGGIVSMIINNLMEAIFGVGTGDNPAAGIIGASRTTTEIIFMLILVVILAPIFEELIFRKLLIDRLRQYGKWPAIIMSSIAFGLFHGNVAQMVYAALVGIILGVIYERYGNVWHVIILHFMVNFMAAVPATVAGLIPNEEIGNSILSGVGFFMLGGAVVGLVFLVLELSNKQNLPQDRQLHFDPNGSISMTEKPLGWTASLTTPGMIMYYVVATIVLVINTISMVS